ncbi:MAG TPA: nuclear transport factor 2 family protein [Chitinophagaceae bacterium]|jgi:ketosteroid isomerase-like protein|nr:nuclear transport factor 2 family protein [Chitinophagaceae bacterium]
MATQEAVMTTKDVANRLYELFQENKWMEAQQELFSKDAESIEPKDSPGLQSVKGIDAIRKKGEDFNNMVEEVHGGWVSEPVVAGKYIAVAMGMDCTYKGMGRQKMDEIALYEVKDGKIVKEQFFY